MLDNGGVTSPRGFKASGIAAGLKRSGKPDMALIFSDSPATVAGAFTTNRVAAAPVLYDRELLENRETVRAVIINSGNANACTGPQGMTDTKRMAECAATRLGCDTDEILVCSTGRIGVPMPMDVIVHGIAAAADALDAVGGGPAATAIMTTDTRPKEAACQLEIDRANVTIGGMAKGAGMIAPKMRTAGLHATMLAYITTDAAVEPVFLKECLDSAVRASFNKINVDGDMSTNDTVLLLANGAAGNQPLTASHPAAENFYSAVEAVAEKLAKAMVLDGEGATKFVEVTVAGAKDAQEARRCADAIANSLLCKTAWFRGDPHWGRILDAAGYADVDLDPDGISLDYNRTPVVRDGMDAGTPEPELAELMKADHLIIELGLGAGAGRATVWTCDISYEYVKINAEYHT